MTDTSINLPARKPRPPMQVVYGGAHLYKSESAQKLGALARQAMETYAPSPDALLALLPATQQGISSEVLFRAVQRKLANEPVEDQRIDFEDGYGPRSNEEEDAHATQAARELAKALQQNLAPRWIGFRVRSLGEQTRARALRTLERFLTTLAEEQCTLGDRSLLITLPKVTSDAELTTLVQHVVQLEHSCGFAKHSLRVEAMIETPDALLDASGVCPLPRWAKNAHGRLEALHLGAYDLLSSLGVLPSQQQLAHPLCVHARAQLVLAGAVAGVRVSDGATTLLPVPLHRGTSLSDAQREENRLRMQHAWRVHCADVLRGIEVGVWQGWDLHPAQLVSRWTAVYAALLQGLEENLARLERFLSTAAQATRVGQAFDDAATAQALLDQVLRALDAGLLEEETLRTRWKIVLEQSRFLRNRLENNASMDFP